MGTFSEKVVLITGANSGMGEATAVAFAEAGAKVYGTARTRETLAGARAKHPNLSWVLLEVRDAQGASTAVQEVVKEAGQLDVLVNNAGAARLIPLSATTPEDIALQFETNVYGLTYVTLAALASLQKAKGNIVNIGSVAGHRPDGRGSIYAASKAAVESLTRSWARELAPQGVRVNAIAPGPVKTPIFGKVGLPLEAIAAMTEQIPKLLPLGRMGEPTDIARWVLALADSSVWVTGQVLSVDGGMSIT
jgi:NAD(P)-dependent dehydrogenase (short-subunit alcohol dehydrogenase family)